ncbi:hypothetical protein HK103_001915 [Boothiomyces macroporosus]|uniref:CAP-Gly domain-containing protein n=1 Tax=Boothiomyces macroporosus TaxID=261099 RepID=A0AAD5UNJ5_9FUNG|nr:hypothetical protein HK103_001915 [Boothiomyces macroporosus]
MGAGASLPELKDKDLEKLAKKNGLTKEGVKFFYNHYAVLQAKIKDPADMENRWMIEKLFDDLFPERETLTFGQYLETLMKFRSQSVDERAEFYFRILNYDKDTVINQADIAVFLQQISNYKFTPGDRVRIANGDDERTGILSFYGKTDFGKGTWAGITLDTPSTLD